jgi:subtilisin family serine protease
MVAGEVDAPCNMHASWVAALAAGLTLGPASASTIHDLHVSRASLTCAFYTSDGIDALAWIAENGTLPGVINLSWQGPGNSVLDAVIGELFGMGYVVISASGNADSDTDACTNSPSRAAYSISVGAIDDTDTKASFSNWGDCVDIWAPGVNVAGASYADDTSIVLASGTSGSTPVVSGVAAVYYSVFGYSTALQVTNKIRNSAVYGQLHGISPFSSNNRLVSFYNWAAVTPSPIHPPAASNRLSVF